MIKIGMVGLSEGNGHPYSWSSIFNGYDKEKMQSSGFPVISDYLMKEKFPDCQIESAIVTHIYTQDKKLSHHISETCMIENISSDITDLVDSVDAVIIARDDAENHFKFSKIPLMKGMPILIDKPLAFTHEEAKRIYSYEQYDGQIFSATGVRYSSIFENIERLKGRVGKIKSIKAESPKDWKKYSVHIIEPILTFFDNLEEIDNHDVSIDMSTTTVDIRSKDMTIQFKTTGLSVGEISFTITGTKGTEKLIFNDTFYSFRSLLNSFITSVIERKRMIPKSLTLKVCEVIDFVK